MQNEEKTYTYRCGQKVDLEKNPDLRVVRALPDQLTDVEIVNAEQVSSASTRITTRASDLDEAMIRSREIAPTYHAYSETETGGQSLRGDEIQGNWKLKVSDRARSDQGKLNRWALQLTAV